MDNTIKKNKHSLTKKVTSGFVVVISLISIIAFCFFYYYNDKSAKQDQIYKANNCASAASNLLHNVPLESFLKNGKTDLYYEYLSQLSVICRNFNLKYLYVYVPDFKNNQLKIIFYVDGKSNENVKTRDLGTIVPWSISEAEKNAFSGISDNKITVTDNQFGHVITRYAGVYNDKNKPIALVGVDISYDAVNSIIMANFFKGILFAVFSLVMMYFGLVLYLEQIFIRPVMLISDRMNNFIEENKPGVDPIVIKSDDEISSMADSFNRMAADINSYIRQISDMQMETIFSLAKLAQSRDDDTGTHLERVQQYCYALSQKLAEDSPYSHLIDDNFIKNIVNASTLHDIGKVGISDLILLKPGKLTEEEFAEMKKHTTIGAATLREVHSKFGNNSFMEMGMIIANYHHERWDGSGYPEGLAGEKIPLPARIMAIADVYDALGTKRVYKEAFPQEMCIEIIRDGRGGQFDPVIVDAFLDLMDDFYRIRQDFSDERSPVIG